MIVIKQATLQGDTSITSENAGKILTPLSSGQIKAISTTSEKQTARRSISTPHISKVWFETTTNALAIGTVNSNTWQNGNYVQLILAGTNGIARAVPPYQDNTPSYFPFGSTGHNYMDWNKSWTVTLRLSVRLATQAGANTSGRFTFIIGNPLISPSSGAGHNLDAKGVSIKIIGKNGTTGTSDITVTAHNGTTETSSSAYTSSSAAGYIFADLELQYIAGVGLYLWMNDVLICELTSGLPSGESAANNNKLGWFTENVSTGASNAATSYVQSIFVIRDN